MHTWPGCSATTGACVRCASWPGSSTWCSAPPMRRPSATPCVSWATSCPASVEDADGRRTSPGQVPARPRPTEDQPRLRVQLRAQPLEELALLAIVLARGRPADEEARLGGLLEPLAHFLIPPHLLAAV